MHPWHAFLENTFKLLDIIHSDSANIFQKVYADNSCNPSIISDKLFSLIYTKPSPNMPFSNSPLNPSCAPSRSPLIGDRDYNPMSYRCREQRELTEGEIQMASEIYRRSIDYSQVRIVRESFFPFKMQGKLTAMAPDGFIYIPAYSPLDSFDYSISRINLQHMFMHEMCHILQYQSGMQVMIRGLDSWLVMYKYEIDFNSSNQKALSDYRMEQQASIISDYWHLLKYGTRDPWPTINNLKDSINKNSAYLIPFYESILNGFLSARNSRMFGSKVLFK